jgi:hypothetical protein
MWVILGLKSDGGGISVYVLTTGRTAGGQRRRGIGGAAVRVYGDYRCGKRTNRKTMEVMAYRRKTQIKPGGRGWWVCKQEPTQALFQT